MNMFKLTIEDKNYTPISERYFDSKESMYTYLNGTFPYYKFSLCDCNCSGTIKNGTEPVFGYSIEKICYTTYENNNNCWGDDSDKKIYEVFNTPDVVDLMRAFDIYIEKMKSNEDCCDSWRICVVGDEKSERLYEKYITCCGRDDTEVEVNGVNYMFGCNFGH